MTDDPVILRIAEADTGRSLDLRQPRWRAEAIVHAGLESWPRYTLEIDPKEGRPLATLLAIAAFVKAFRTPIVLALVAGAILLSAVLAIHLPAAQYRVYPVAALALVSFFTGFFAPRPTLPTL